MCSGGELTQSVVANSCSVKMSRVAEPFHSPLLCILPDVLEQPDMMDILRVSSRVLYH